ncbi:MAG TPA: hypothetical protein VGK81_08390, partial [Anaerolineae bacterium]
MYEIIDGSLESGYDLMNLTGGLYVTASIPASDTPPATNAINYLGLTLMQSAFRKTTQRLAPVRHERIPADQYDIYPGYDLGERKIALGYAALAETLAGQRR